MSEAEEPLASAEVISLEAGLVAKAQRGDGDALRRLLARHIDALYAQVILPRIGDRALAEDILRETLLAAIEGLGRFRWRNRSIYFWLRQIALNKVVDHHRADERNRRLAQTLAVEPEPIAAPSSLTPELALIAAQEQQINSERIGRAIEAINACYRKAITLRLIEGRSREESAAELQVTLGTFDVLLHRALRAFRKEFDGDE